MQTHRLPHAKTKNTVPDNGDKISLLSDALKTVYKGAFDFLQGMTPIDTIITMTWVFNKKGSGVVTRFQLHPYLRIDASLDLQGNTLEVPEVVIWRFTSYKLMHFQLMCPVRHVFGMDCNPCDYIMS